MARENSLPPVNADGTRPEAESRPLTGHVSTGAGWLSGLLGWTLISAVLLNLANVISRYAFDTAVVGAEEVQVFTMVWIAFVGCAVVAWREEHLRMDVCVGYLPAWARSALKGLEALLLLLLSGFMLYQSFLFTLQMIQVGRNSDALGVPMAVPHSGVVAGFALLTVVALLQLLRVRRPAETDPSRLNS
jgi:TRAP-type C4-dicarboxylate transport system permease small subunit